MNERRVGRRIREELKLVVVRGVRESGLGRGWSINAGRASD